MKSKKIAILYPILFFFATSMFIRSWVPALHSSWPSMFAGCLLSIYVAPQFLRTRWFLWILLYAMVVLLNWLSGDKLFDSSMVVANEIANLFLFSSFCFYCISYNDAKCIKVTLVSMFVLISIAAIGSFIVNQINPLIVREQATIAEMGNEDMIFAYYRMGLSNYLLPHGLPAIIPPLILILKRSGHRKWMQFLFAVFLFFTLLLIYLGGSTTVLLLSVIALSTFLISDKSYNQKSSTFIIIITILFLPFLFVPELLEGLIGLFSSETGETYAFHLQDVADYSSGASTGDTGLRVELYQRALSEFLANPFVGTNNGVPNHSVILDRMGSLGLIGIVPYIYIIISFVIFVRGSLDKTENVFFNVSVIVMVLMLCLKGIEDKEIWLMFFAVTSLLFYVTHQLKYKK